MKAIILAAGKGKRMRPLTTHKPKALIEFRGKPLLWHVLRQAEKAGIKEALIVIGFRGNSVKKFFGKKSGKISLNYAWQKKQLGTAHALKQAEGKTGKEFIVLSCDVIASFTLIKKIASKKGFDAVLALRKEKHPEKFGVVSVKNGRIIGLIEKPARPEGNLVNAGIYRFKENVFDAISRVKKSGRNEFELTDAIKLMIASEKKVGFVKAGGKILDIGSLKDLK